MSPHLPNLFYPSYTSPFLPNQANQYPFPYLSTLSTHTQLQHPIPSPVPSILNPQPIIAMTPVQIHTISPRSDTQPLKYPTMPQHVPISIAPFCLANPIVHHLPNLGHNQMPYQLAACSTVVSHISPSFVTPSSFVVQSHNSKKQAKIYNNPKPS